MLPLQTQGVPGPGIVLGMMVERGVVRGLALSLKVVLGEVQVAVQESALRLKREWGVEVFGEKLAGVRMLPEVCWAKGLLQWPQRGLAHRQKKNDAESCTTIIQPFNIRGNQHTTGPCRSANLQRQFPNTGR